MERDKILDSEQNRRLNQIELHIGTINEEIGEVKIEMEKIRTEIANVRTEFVEKISLLIKIIAELKANKKDSIYSVIIPLLCTLTTALAVYTLTHH